MSKDSRPFSGESRPFSSDSRPFSGGSRPVTGASGRSSAVMSPTQSMSISTALHPRIMGIYEDKVRDCVSAGDIGFGSTSVKKSVYAGVDLNVCDIIYVSL